MDNPGNSEQRTIDSSEQLDTSAPSGLDTTVASDVSDSDNSLFSIKKPSKIPRIRKRKRRLYEQLRNQIAYYFSDANLRSDKFMRKLLEVDANPGDGSRDDVLFGTKQIPLTSFMTFNRIAQLTSDQNDLLNAFKYESQFVAYQITLNFDGTSGMISRKEPFFNNTVGADMINDKTIYVEKFNVNKNKVIVDWLKGIFSNFGTVLSVKTPRYPVTKQLMGFGFVEFEMKNNAERALQFFEEIEALKAEKNDDIGEVASKSSTCDDLSNKKIAFEAHEVEEISKLRVISKRQYNQYRKRYLKLQKEAATTAHTLPMNNRQLCQEILANFDISKPKTYNKRTFADVNPNESQAISSSNSSSTNFIVQIDLHITTATLDSNKLRKFLRSLFEDRPDLPDASHIAYIDTAADNSMEFNSDGSYSQKIYIRTRTVEAAEHLTTGGVVELLQNEINQTFGNGLGVSKVALLNEQQVNTYWEVAKMSKRAKKN